ncbi:MAG: hydroxyethylthiazole kinase, partial [Synergistales bacterium]|nr:hydroxyethylthiazole kinase [Synergistales bacterium]
MTLSPQRLADCWDALDIRRPLLYHITNLVAMSGQAHAALAVGAAPVMSFHPGEAEAFPDAADGLLCTIGTPTEESMEAMRRAVVAAGERGIPVVLDPVGYG